MNGDNESERERARQAAVAAARGQVQRAQQLLNTAQARVQANWKANPQYLLAIKEQEDARKAFGAERDRVLDGLKNDPNYADLTRAEIEATDDVVAEQQKTNAAQPASQPFTAAPPDPSPEQVQAAQARLDRKAKVRKALDNAIAADPAASKAKARLDKADTDLQVFALQLKASLLNDSDYKSALDQLTQARAQLTAAAGSNP